jgi:hypothetical protein
MVLRRLRPSRGVFVAADVHYLASAGARAAAVGASDATFAHVAHQLKREFERP